METEDTSQVTENSSVGETEQIFVRQLADGSLVTPDGQRLVFSKDDITEIQFTPDGETVMMASEESSKVANSSDQIVEKENGHVPKEESYDENSTVEGEVSEIDGDVSFEDSINENSEGNQSTDEKGDGSSVRRSTRVRKPTEKSVLEEIAAEFDEEVLPQASPHRGRQMKESLFEEPEVLHIASPLHLERRGRGRPRKSEVAERNEFFKRPGASAEEPSGSIVKKRSALASTPDVKGATPKKQVRISDSPSVYDESTMPHTPASAIIPSEYESPQEVYDFDDESPQKVNTTTEIIATPSTSQADSESAPEVGLNTSIETQTDEPEHIEVIIWEQSANKRTIQTQTDPRLKLKKVKTELTIFGEEDDDSPKRRRRRSDFEDEFSLFEDKRRKRTTEEALKCPFCEKSFIGLVKHIKSRHCDEPDYDEEMRNARWRERIMKVSTGNDVIGDPCDDCGKITQNVKRHRESHQMERMHIPCPMCNKIVLKAGLSSHMRTVHSGRKPYKCPHCDYTSAFRGNLNTHVKGMHLHTRQYLCNVCQAAFKTLGALIGHTKRVHEGWKSPNQKIFICSVCEKRFTKKYHVDRHMLIHTGEKPHKCDDCQRSFNNKSNLMSHIQLVHKRLSPYQCDLCKETFKRKKLLLEHIGRVHVSRGEHIVFRSSIEDTRPRRINQPIDPHDDAHVLQEVNQEALFGDGNQVQLATVVSMEEAANLTEGQHYTTLQTEGGEETIIIVHSGDVNDVAQAIMTQEDGSTPHQVYMENE